MNDSTVNVTDSDADNVFVHNPTWRRVMYASIGALSICFNSVLCAIVLRNKRLLKNSYYVLVLVLAVVDTITGIFIIVSPSFVLGNETIPIPAGPAARSFCIFMQYNFFVWVLAKISVFIVMCMAVERWYALVRPLRYKITFTPQKALLYVAILTSIVVIVTIPTLFQSIAKTNGDQTVCVLGPLMGSFMAGQVFTVIYCTITAFLPFTIIIATFIHLQFHIMADTSHHQTLAQQNRRQKEITLSRMSAAVAFVLMIFIFPSQITYILFFFNLAKLDMVSVFATLNMFNSVFNPWIYCFTNKVYRKEFVKMCRFVYPMKNVAPTAMQGENQKGRPVFVG